MIELCGVSKLYGQKVAVNDLNLSVAAGELFAFLGPNGAGKTTTIKMIVGLLFPTAGTVRVGGFDMATHGDHARQLISYVPDQPFLYEKLTGREFLRFIAEMYNLPRERIDERLNAVIEMFHLHEFVDELTERYSHGMRQRTVFAGALLHEPKVLIVDEPTVGLDPRSVRELKDLLRAQAKGGTTVFLSTHLARHRPGVGRPHRHRGARPARRPGHARIVARPGGDERVARRRVPEDHRGSG